MPSLYILKAVCAGLIVFIHLPGIGGQMEATMMQPLMRIGVPVFFMISGFFLVEGASLDATKVRKQLSKICILAIYIYAIYIGFLIIRNVLSDLPAISPRWVSWAFITRMLFIGDNVDSVLWYITAYIEALLIIWLLIKFLKPAEVVRLLTYISPFLLICAILFNRYSGLIGPTYDIAVSRNALTVALPCIFAGSMVRIYRNWFDQISHQCIVLAICIVLAYVEYWCLHIFDIDGSGADFNIMTFPLAFVTFINCVAKPNFKALPKKLGNALVSIGKNHSAGIYLYHSLAYQILALLIVMSGNTVFQIFANAEAIIVIILIFSLAKHYIKNRWSTVRLNS